MANNPRESYDATNSRRVPDGNQGEVLLDPRFVAYNHAQVTQAPAPKQRDYGEHLGELGAGHHEVQNLALQEVEEVAGKPNLERPNTAAGVSNEVSAEYAQRWGAMEGAPARAVNANALQKQALDFFMSKKGGGWTREQAIGIVANLTAESGMRWQVVGDGGKAVGLAQWHPDRQAEFAKAFGHDMRQSTFEEQLAFVNYELTQGRETSAGNTLRMADTSARAAAVVSSYYERPADQRGQELARASMARNLDAGLPHGGDYANLKVASVGQVAPSKQPSANSPSILDRARGLINRLTA